MQALAHSETLRTLLRDEQTWLVRAEQAITAMRHQREREVHRFWPAVWRQWVVAVMFAGVTTVRPAPATCGPHGLTQSNWRICGSEWIDST